MLLGQLGEVEVQDGEASRGDIARRQAVDHQHGPHRPLPLPVAGDGVVEVVGVQALAGLVVRHPAGHLLLDPGQVRLEAVVHVGRQHLGQVQATRQQLAGGEGGDGVGIGQI